MGRGWLGYEDLQRERRLENKSKDEGLGYVERGGGKEGKDV